MNNNNIPAVSRETAEAIIQFSEDRDWRQFHNPKDLAISISLEAAELLETFQWSGSDTECPEKREKVREELADVVNLCILMADACGIDLDEALQAKLLRNGEKYPVDKAKGRKEKYTEL